MIILIALAAVVFTLLGGLFAIYYKDKLHLIIGFSAGAVLAVSLFHLIPESIEVLSSQYEIHTIVMIVAIGFIIYMILDRTFSLHMHEVEHCCDLQHGGRLGASTLAIHSCFDGLGIGLAFQLSPAIGLVFAAAVLAHNFSDGLNTVNIIFKNHGQNNDAFKWLLVAAIAPFIGVILGTVIVLPTMVIGILLAIFSGFFLYLSASDLIPESYHSHKSYWTTFMTIIGMTFIWLIVHFVH